MALIVEDGTGVSGANSYVSVADADVYFSTRLHAQAWQEAGGDTKEAALIHATRLLDRVTYDGAPSLATQALRWPRCGVYSADGAWVEITSIPQSLRDANAELALRVIEDDRETSTERTEQSISLGDASVTWAVDRSTHTLIPGYILDMVRAYVAPRRTIRA